MFINDAATATEYLRAWGDKMRPARLAYAIKGLETASAIMESASKRYSVDERANYREAIGVLRLAHFRLCGKAAVL